MTLIEREDPYKTSTVIWDLDGTLLDSFGIHVDIMTQILPKYGFPVPTTAMLAHHFHGRLEESIRGVVGNIDEKQFAALVRDFLAIDNQYIQDITHHLFVDSIALAKRAHEWGARQILVTNRSHGVDRGMASPRNMVQGSILREYIDTVICGDEVEIRKPNPQVLGDILQDIVPEETLVIGDQFVDAQFAGNLGGRAVLINRYEGKIAHLEQLPEGWQNYTAIVRSLHDARL